MHGVQPKAKAMPTSSAPNGPAGLDGVWIALVLVEPLDPEDGQMEAEEDHQRAGDAFDDRRSGRRSWPIALAAGAERR